MIRMLCFVVLVGCAAATPAPQSAASPVASLAGRRAQLIGWLHDYRMAGVFPKADNGRMLSVFVDAQGVRCPMAELVHASGRDDLVDAVHRENNTVRLASVHSGPLFDWMLASGLTQEEIAMVQGAMNIYEGNNFFILGTADATQLATDKAAVQGQLQMAETALRQATATSLAIAASRLPTPDIAALAATPIGSGSLLAAQ